MDENKINHLFKIIFYIFGILVFLCFLKIAGFFNFLYFQRLNSILNKDMESYRAYIENKIKITKTIADDTIIQSALIQYGYKDQLMDTYKHLTLYKRNFREVRNIALFNPLYDIVLASEIDEHIINKNLNKEWFLNAAARGNYISEISYMDKYNEFMITIIYPVKNIIDETIGFLMVDFSLSGVFEKFDRFKGTAVILKKQDKFVFTYPLDLLVKKKEDMNKFTKVIERNYNADYTFIIAAQRVFFTLPLYLKIILSLSFLLLVLFFLYYSFEKYSRTVTSRNEKLKKITRDIINFSRDIMSKAPEKNPMIKRNTEDDISKEFIPRRRGSEYIEKETPKTRKHGKADNRGFIFME